MPREDGRANQPTEWNRQDGFSPGQPISSTSRALDPAGFAASGMVGHQPWPQYTAKNQRCSCSTRRPASAGGWASSTRFDGIPAGSRQPDHTPRQGTHPGPPHVVVLTQPQGPCTLAGLKKTWVARPRQVAAKAKVNASKVTGPGTSRWPRTSPLTGGCEHREKAFKSVGDTKPPTEDPGQLARLHGHQRSRIHRGADRGSRRDRQGQRALIPQPAGCPPGARSTTRATRRKRDNAERGTNIEVAPFPATSRGPPPRPGPDRRFLRAGLLGDHTQTRGQHQGHCVVEHKFTFCAHDWRGCRSRRPQTRSRSRGVSTSLAGDRL